MASILLVLDVEGQTRRYTSAASEETVSGETYRPGLQVGSVPQHSLGQTAVSVDDADTDWATTLMGYDLPPLWTASLYYADANGRIQLQTGVARVLGPAPNASLLELTIDSSQVRGSKLVPDPASSLISAGDFPGEDHTSPSYVQDEATIGAYYPRVYGAPGLSAMEADATTGGPTTPAYLVELGVGALNYQGSRVAIASPATPAATITLYDVSSGFDGSGYKSASVSTQTITDARGREVQVVDFQGLTGIAAVLGTEYGAAWDVSDPATDRRASYVVEDLMRAGNIPVDEARMWLSGLRIDTAITEPVDPVQWVLQHFGALPLVIGRSASGFYARLVPIDQQWTDMDLELTSTDDYDGLQMPDPAQVPSEVLVRYGPIAGELSRTVRLTPTGAEDGATGSPVCAIAFAAGYRGTAEQNLPIVCDPSTAGRVAALIALDRCRPGMQTTLTVSDPTVVRAVLSLGPAFVINITADNTTSPTGPGLAGYRLINDAQSVSAEGVLTMTVSVYR